MAENRVNMKYNPDLHNRRSIRLRCYDYANAGAYFVTICLNIRMDQTLPQNSQTLPQKGRHAGLPLRSIRARTNANTNFGFPTLGTVENNAMILNDCGKMVEKYIVEIINNADKFSDVKIGEYVIMPDHVHAIIEIDHTHIRRGRPACLPYLQQCLPYLQQCLPYLQQCLLNLPPNSQTLPPQAIKLGTVIQWFKTMTTNEYANNVKTLGWQPFDKKLWQRNYYEHIIRNEIECAKIAEYIRNNPISWKRQYLDTILRNPAEPI